MKNSFQEPEFITDEELEAQMAEQAKPARLNPSNESPEYITDEELAAYGRQEGDDSTAQTLKDAAMGGVQGLTFGGADELAGAIGALPSILDPNKKYLEEYRDIQKQAEGKFTEAEERSPTAFFAGDIAGSVLPAILTGGGSAAASAAKTGTKLGLKGLAKYGAKQGLKTVPIATVEGGLRSKDTGLDVIDDALVSGALGGVLSGGVSSLAKGGGQVLSAAKGKASKIVDDFIENSPTYGALKAAYKAKENLGTVAGLETIAKEVPELARDVTHTVYKGRDIAGRGIDEALTSPGMADEIIDVSDKAAEASKDIINYLAGPGRSPTTATRKILAKLEKLSATPKIEEGLAEGVEVFSRPGVSSSARDLSNMSPKEAKELLDELRELANKFGTGIDETQTKESVYKVIDALDTKLKQYPEYASAVSTFKNLSEKFPETIMHGDTAKEFRPSQLKDITQPAMYQQVENFIRRVGDTGNKSSIGDFASFRDNLLKLAKESPEIWEELKKDPQAMISKIKEVARRAEVAAEVAKKGGLATRSLPTVLGGAAGGAVGGVPGAVLGAGLGTAIGGTRTLLGRSYIAANRTGRAVRAIDEKISGPIKAYQASLEKTKDWAASMINSSSPPLQAMGKKLAEAIENKDTVAKNAIIFSLLQNPEARPLMRDLDQEE